MVTEVSLATNRPSLLNFCANLAGDHYLRAVRLEAVGAVCIAPIFATTLTAAHSRNSVTTATTAAATVATATAAMATDAVITTALIRVEPRRQSQPTAHLRLQSSPLPRLLRWLLPRLLWLLPRLHRLEQTLPLRRMSTSRRHRALSFRSSQVPLLRAH